MFFNIKRPKWRFFKKRTYKGRFTVRPMPDPGPHEHALPDDRWIAFECWATKLPAHPTRQQIIHRRYTYQPRNTISLGEHGRILGCVGGRLFALERPDKSVIIVCRSAVLKLRDTEAIRLKLHTMWFYTNHYHVMDAWGFLKGVIRYDFPWIENDTITCEQSVCPCKSK